MATRAQTKTISKTTSVLISRQLIYTCALWLLAVCMMVMFCQSAAGQPPRVERAYDIVDEKWRVVPLRPGATPRRAKEHRELYREAANRVRASIKSARDTLASGGNVATVTPFFLGYVYPMMKVRDEAVVSDLGQTRADYVKNYLGPKVKGTTRSGLIALTITNMQKIQADASLHAANRLSAVYLIGILDEIPAARLEGQAPVPSKAALVALARILLSNDAGTPDYLKIAAIAGIQRHLEIDKLIGGGQIPVDQKRALNQKCIELLNSQEETPVAYWLKRRSMQVLGLIGEPSSAGPAVAVLKSDAGMWLKLDAVQALHEIQTGSLGAAKNLAAAVAISDFATQAIKQESSNIEATVGKIVFNGILHQNLDLLARPSDYQAQLAVPTGEIGGFGGGRGPSYTPNFGDTDYGFGGSPFGGGAVAAGKESDKPQFELPGYHLNLIRRRIKSIAYLCSQTLGGANGDLGLKQYVADDGKSFIENVVQELGDLLVESNAGIIDLDNPPEELEIGEEPPGTATHQLTEMCKESSKILASYLRKQRGEPEPIEEAPAPANPLVPTNPLVPSATASATPAGNPLIGGAAAAEPANPLVGGEVAAPANPLAPAN